MAIDISATRSRRSLLKALVGAVTATVAATAAGAQRAFAAGDDGQPIVIGTYYNDIRTPTNLGMATGTTGYALSGQGPDGGLYGSGGRYGVRGDSQRAGYGVHGVGPYVAVRGQSTAKGTTNGSGVGVFGTSASPDGAGVDGRSPNIGVRGVSAGTGVFGEGDGGGTGVLGNTQTGRAVVGLARAESGAGVGVMGESFADRGTGVRGWAAGDATGVLGFSGGSGVPDAPPKTGVYGFAGQDGRSVGVRGVSPTGRGGLFAGRSAQLRLQPSSAATHPARGATGDLFVDSAGRLWYCKGGTAWKQIA